MVNTDEFNYLIDGIYLAFDEEGSVYFRCDCKMPETRLCQSCQLKIGRFLGNGIHFYGRE